jgi:hypothetical protein
LLRSGLTRRPPPNNQYTRKKIITFLSSVPPNLEATNQLTLDCHGGNRHTQELKTIISNTPYFASLDNKTKQDILDL